MSLDIHQTANAADSNTANVDGDKTQTDEPKMVETASTETVNTVAESVRMETHKRVLQESKLFKERALKAESVLQKNEQVNLEEQGKFKELSERYKTKLETLEQREVETNLNNAVQQYATKAGCVNIESLMKLGDASLLQYDQKTGQVHGVELFIEDSQKNHPYLFGSKSTPNINHGMPGGDYKEKVLNAADISKLRGTDPVQYNKIMDQLGKDAAMRQRGQKTALT